MNTVRSFLVTFGAVAGAVLVACGSGSNGSSGGSDNAPISAASYDHSCTTAADCMNVFSGNLCEGCACPNDVIGVSGRAAYDADVSKLKATCSPKAAINCDCTQSPTYLCQQKKCTVVAPGTDAGADGG